MITTEHRNFLRIILLLYDAASFILRHIVVRELEKHRDDLDNLLAQDEFENKLKHQLHFGKSQVEKLFPSNGKSDIQTWDSQMLAVVSLLIFRSTLSSDEKYHIKFIKLTRNNAAHKSSASYFEEDFVDEKDGIVKAITILASSFDTTVQESCSKLISTYCSDPLDTHVQLAIKHLEEDANNGELLRQILDAVNEKHEIVRKDIQDHAEKIEKTINLTEKKICERQETVLKSLNGLCLDIGSFESKVTESKEGSSQELKQINASLTSHIVKESEKVLQKVDTNNSLLQEVQRNQNEHAANLETKLEELKKLFEQTTRIGGHCSKQIKFGTHTHLTVDGPTQEWINTVETVLKSVFDILLNKVQEPGQNPETEKAVEEFLKFIEGFKGVELKAVERKCVLLAFECLTYESLRELIEFINSNGFHRYLDSIARALENDLNIPQKLVVSSEIPVSSLQLVFDHKSSSIEPDSKKGIALSFECTSINGLDAFWRLFVKGEATPYIDKIAATVSSEVGEKTSLSTSVNLQEFEEALTYLEATVTKEKETGLLKPYRETTHQSSDFELDFDTIETRKDSELGVKENYQYEFTKPDPLHSVYGSFQDTKSGDLKEHSEISEQSYQTEQANISSSHHNNFISLKYLKMIHLQYSTDPYSTKIYACAILSHERLMIADNKGLSVVNIHTGLVEQEKTRKTLNSDIAVLPKDQVAVALPLDDEILILKTKDMSFVRSIPDVNRPFGITYHKDELYVVCICIPDYTGLCVNILNLLGDRLRKVKCDKVSLNEFSSFKIAVSVDVQNLYILESRSLIRFSAHGRLIDRKRNAWDEPKSLNLLDDGSLVVISESINTIHKMYTIHNISADLKKGCKLILDKKNVRFIGVDPVHNQIYVIYFDKIKVYDMQKCPSQCQPDDVRLASLKAGKKLPSLKTDKKLPSLETDKKLPSLKTDKKLHSLETDKKLPSLESDEELPCLETDKKLPSLETDESTSFAGKPMMLTFHQSEQKQKTKQNTCHLI